MKVTVYNGYVAIKLVVYNNSCREMQNATKESKAIDMDNIRSTSSDQRDSSTYKTSNIKSFLQ